MTPDSGTPDSGVADSGTPDSGTPDSGTPDAGPTHYDLTILHTNDLHSYVESQGPVLDYSPLTPGNDTTVGGFARLAAAIKTERTAAGTTPVLLLDSGDFMMGTLFQTVGTSVAAELTEMGHMGYDAITFGNHEFDFTPMGLAGFLYAATQNGFNVPIVASNLQFSATDSGDDYLAAYQTAGLIVPKLVKTLPNGLKVGIFGLLGKDAVNVSPLAAPVTFADQTTTAQAMVNELRNTDHVDLVILISHSGSFANGSGEDVDLANAVSGIDVIISGHTHQALPTPLKVGKTVIVQSGAYGSNLGELKLTVTPSAATATVMDAYRLIPLDDSIAGDPDTQTRVDAYVQDIDQLFAPAGLSYHQVVAQTAFDIPTQDFRETPLGDLVTDAFLKVAQQYQTAESVPVAQAAVEVGSNIRTSLWAGQTGHISFADLFKVEPLGLGPDLQPGYPLVTFYLNGKDIKAGLELSSLAQLKNNNSYWLQLSGMTYTFNSGGAPFSRVVSASIGGNPVNFTDAATCYPIVATEYVAKLLSLVASASGGALVVTPKESDCTTVMTDFDAAIVDADPATAGIQELHQWAALYGYMSQFPDTDSVPDGIPNVPAVYSASQGRVVIQ